MDVAAECVDPVGHVLQAGAVARGSGVETPAVVEVLFLPAGAQPSARKYLDWHQHKVFVT